MTVAAIQACTDWITNADGSVSCTAFEWQQTYLIPPEASAYVDILVSGGFDAQSFGIGFFGVMGVFVTGLAGGWIASLLRRMR